MEEQTANQTDNYGTKPIWQKIALYLVVGGVIYGLIYFLFIANRNTYNAGSSNQYQPTVAQSTITPTSNLPTNPAQEINVNGNEFTFNPSIITVKKGQSVQITFKNTGKFPHDFTISNLDIRTKVIQSGESDTIQFTPQSTGNFEFICSVPSHADRGMKGTLIVQ